MKNIRTPRKQLYVGANIFYVKSKSGGEEHIVVQRNGATYCDCKDFMTRKLPLLGTPAFSLCSHGKQVNDYALRILTPAPKSKKKYGIFFTTRLGKYRSADFPYLYDTKTEAQRAINTGSRQVAYHIEEL